MTDRTLADLIQQRKQLSRDVINLYSPEHFPGSRAWHAQERAECALHAFDAAHPEVVAHLKAVRPEPEYKRDPHSHYNRALRMED